MVRTALPLFATLCALVSFTFAQEDEPVIDAVAETVAALRKADPEQFKDLAERDEPDPWLVADRLLRNGDRELARRFATAKARPAVAGLPEYLRTDPRPSSAVAEAISLAQLRLEDDEATKPQLEGAIRALTAVVEGATPMEQARLHSLLGLAHAYAGDVVASSRALGSAATVAGRIGWLREAADALGTQSENARVLLRYDEAIEIARREVELRQRLGNEPRLVAHLQRIAQLFDENGDLGAATRELDGWAGKLSPAADTELALSRANLRLQQADLEAALDVLRSKVQPRDADQSARVRMLAGDILRQQGNEAQAFESYRKAITQFEKTENPVALGRALGNAGISLVRMGKPEQARPLLESAQAQFDRAGDRNLVALAVLFRGDARLAAGEHALALRLFNSVRTFAARTQDGWLEANAQIRRGRALLAGGQLDDARKAFAACYELGGMARAPELQAEGAVGEARCLLRQAHGTRAAEAVDRAYTALAPLIDARAVPPGDEARRIFDLIAAARVEAALLLDSEIDLWRAIELQRLGQQIRTAREIRLLHKLAMTVEMRQAEADARRRIQRSALFEDRARAEDDRATAVRWKAAREKAERDLDTVIDSVVFAARPGWERLVPSPGTLNNLRERLTPSEVLVSYALSDGRAAALVVSRAEVRLVRLADSATLRSAGAKEQAGLLIEPLNLRKRQSRVVLILPAELNHVVWDAIDPARRHVRMPSATEFDRLRARRSGRSSWRVYTAPIPSVRSIEEGPSTAKVVVITEPIDGPALPRAFFLRGTSVVLAPREPGRVAAAGDIAAEWALSATVPPGWVVWGG